jgi:ribosomal protein S18 acetylase RimI-like enzyme
MSNYSVKIVSDVQEMQQAFHLVIQLSEHLTPESYQHMLKEMVQHTYKQCWVMEGDKIVGLSGFWMLTKLYSDKYMEFDNVIVDPDYRSKGIGKLLMDKLTEIAIENGCKTLMLDAYVNNRKGHHFYFRE